MGTENCSRLLQKARPAVAADAEISPESLGSVLLETAGSKRVTYRLGAGPPGHDCAT